MAFLIFWEKNFDQIFDLFKICHKSLKTFLMMFKVLFSRVKLILPFRKWYFIDKKNNKFWEKFGRSNFEKKWSKILKKYFFEKFY